MSPMIPTSPMGGSVLIQGGTLVTMDAARRIVPGDLLVVDGRITGVGEGLAPPPGTRTLLAHGKVVLPGFVQGHVHLGQALFRGLAEGLHLMDWLRRRIWPLEAAHTDASAYWSGALGAAECLLSGTTTIHEIGLVREMDAIYRAIADSGLRAVAGKCLMDQGLGVPGALLEPAADALAEARALHQSWHGAQGGRITSALCPRFILSCSESLWAGTVALARSEGLPIHTHLLEHPGEGREIREALGIGELEYFDRLGVLDCDLRIAHGVQLRPSHLEVLAGRPLGVCHCPSANLKLGSGIADLAFLRSASNLKVGIGCDGAPCNNDMDMLEEVRLCALLQQWVQGPGRFGAEQAIAMATCEGAKALGLDAMIGSLEVGKAGDVCVWDLRRPGSFGAQRVSIYDRLVFGASKEALDWVVVDGRVVVERGQVATLDAQALARRPGEEIEALLARAALD